MSVKFEMDGQVAIATFAAPPMNLLTIEFDRGLRRRRAGRAGCKRAGVSYHGRGR